MIRTVWFRALLLRMLALTVGLVAALGIGEFAARLAEARGKAPRPAAPRLPLFEANPHGSGSYRMKPNLRLTAEVEGRSIAVHTNSHGMRWREVDVEKPKGVRRIAVLGDSFGFGCWSSTIETSFGAVLESQLGPGTEVLNFGVGGYGFEDELLLLREEVMRFSPDDVLIASFNGNDIRDSFLYTTRYAIREGTVELVEDALEARVPPRHRTAPFVDPQPVTPRGALGLLWHSAFARLVLRATDRDPPFLDYEVSQRFNSYSFWSQWPYPEVASKAVARSTEILEQIRLVSKAGGARLLIAAIPTAEQVYAIHPVGPGFDISFPQAALSQWAETAKVPFLDLLPVLRETTRSSGRRPYLRYDVHFNDFGHKVAGESMGQWIRRVAPFQP